MVQRHRKFFSYTVLAGMIFNLLSPLFLLPWQKVWACFGAWDCDGNSYCAGAGSYPDHPGSCASYGERGNNDRTTSEIAQDYINNGGNPAEVVTRTQDFQGALSNNDAAAAAARAQELAVAEAQRIAAEQAAAANAAAAAAAAKAADDKAKAEAQRVAQEAAERSARAAANAAAAATAMTPLSGATPAGTPAVGATVPAAAAPTPTTTATGANCGSSSHNACSPNSDGNWYRCNNGSWQKADDCKPAGAINCVSGCAGANGCVDEGKTGGQYAGNVMVCDKGKWIPQGTDQPTISQKPENLAEKIDEAWDAQYINPPIVIKPPASPTARPIAAAPTIAVAPPSSAPIPTAPAQQTDQEQFLEKFRCGERGGTWIGNTCLSPGRPSPTIAPNPTAAMGPFQPTPTPTVASIPPVKPDDTKGSGRLSRGMALPVPLITAAPTKIPNFFTPPDRNSREDRAQTVASEVCRPGISRNQDGTCADPTSNIKIETETVRVGGGTFGQEVKITTKTFCSGKSVVTQSSRSDGVESSDSTACEWGCDGGVCRGPTPEEAQVYRYSVLQNAIEREQIACQQRAGGDNRDTDRCTPATVYNKAVTNLQAGELSPIQTEIYNQAGREDSVIQAISNGKYEELEEQVLLASAAASEQGVETPLTEDQKANLRKQADQYAEEVVNSGSLSATGYNTLNAESQVWDKIANVSAEEAQRLIDQQGWFYGTMIAKPMFCGINNNYRASGACGVEYTSAVNKNAQDSSQGYWSFLIAGKSEQTLWDQGMVFGDARSAGFQAREYDDRVAPACGVQPWERTLTEEETACLTGQSVAAKARLAEIDEQNAQMAALNIGSAALGFAGGAVTAGIKAVDIASKIAKVTIGSGAISDAVIAVGMAESMTAGDRAAAAVVEAMSKAEGISDTERRVYSEQAEEMTVQTDEAYTQNVMYGVFFAAVGNVAGEVGLPVIGKATRETLEKTKIGKSLVEFFFGANPGRAAGEIADAMNSAMVTGDGTPLTMKPETVGVKEIGQSGGNVQFVIPGVPMREVPAGEVGNILINPPQGTLVRSADGKIFIADSTGSFHVLTAEDGLAPASVGTVAGRVATADNVLAAKKTLTDAKESGKALGQQAVITGNIPVAGKKVAKIVEAIPVEPDTLFGRAAQTVESVKEAIAVPAGSLFDQAAKTANNLAEVPAAVGGGIRNLADNTRKAVGGVVDNVSEALPFGRKSGLDLEGPPASAAKNTGEAFPETGIVEVIPKGGGEPYRVDYDPNNLQTLDSLRPGDTVDDVRGQGWIKNEDGTWSSLGEEVGGGGEGGSTVSISESEEIQPEKLDIIVGSESPIRVPGTVGTEISLNGKTAIKIGRDKADSVVVNGKLIRSPHSLHDGDEVIINGIRAEVKMTPSGLRITSAGEIAPLSKPLESFQPISKPQFDAENALAMSRDSFDQLDRTEQIGLMNKLEIQVEKPNSEMMQQGKENIRGIFGKDDWRITTAGDLKKAGLEPKYKIEIDGVTSSGQSANTAFYFSDVFEDPNGRLYAIGYSGEPPSPKVFYKSNSHGNWRVAPDAILYLKDKGYNIILGKGNIPKLGVQEEFATTITTELQTALSDLAKNPKKVKNADSLAFGLLNLDKASDQSSSLAENIRIESLFERDPKTGKRIFKDPGYEPDYSRVVYEYDSTACPPGLTCSGKAVVFASKDGQIHYTYFYDPASGRVWPLSVGSSNSPVNELGTRSLYFDSGDYFIDSPYEYRDIVEQDFDMKQYARPVPKANQYYDVYGYIERKPHIREAKAAIQQTVGETIPAGEARGLAGFLQRTKDVLNGFASKGEVVNIPYPDKVSQLAGENVPIVKTFTDRWPQVTKDLESELRKGATLNEAVETVMSKLRRGGSYEISLNDGQIDHYFRPDVENAAKSIDEQLRGGGRSYSGLGIVAPGFREGELFGPNGPAVKASKAVGETISSIGGDINARFSKGSSLDEFVGPTGVIHNSEFLADVRPDPGLENAVRARPETGYTNQLKAYLEENPVRFGLDADGNRIPLGAEDAAKLREASLKGLRPDEVPAIVVTPEGDGSKLRLEDLFKCDPLSLRFQFIPRVFATGRGPCQISAYPNSTIRRPNGVVEEFSTTEDIGGGGYGRVARTGPGEFSKIAHDAERVQYLIAEKRWLENADRLGFGDILPKVTGDIYDESGQFIGFTMTEIENAVTLSQWPFLIPERVLRPFLDRLAELDNLGLFHRDIFPKNVMVVLEPAPVEKGFRVRNLVLIDPIEPISGSISHRFLDSRFPLAKSYSESGFYGTRTLADDSLAVIVPKGNVDAGKALIDQHNFTVAHAEYSQVRNPLPEEELRGIANHEVSSKYGLIPADELPTTDGQSITRDDYAGIKNQSGTGLERTTDDLADNLDLPCNLITFTIIPQVYAGSRDPCPITLFGPNGPAAKASKAVKDFFGGEELPVKPGREGVGGGDGGIIPSDEPFWPGGWIGNAAENTAKAVRNAVNSVSEALPFEKKPVDVEIRSSVSAAQAEKLSETITKPLEDNPELLSTVGPFVETVQDMLKRKPDVIVLPGDSAVRYEEAIRSISKVKGIDEVPPIITFPTDNQWISIEKEIGGQIVKVGQELPGPNMLAYKDLSDFTSLGSRLGMDGVFYTADSHMKNRLRTAPNDERLLAIQGVLKSAREDYNRRPTGLISPFESWKPSIELRLALLELFYPEKMAALANARSVAFFDDVALTGRKLCCYEDLFDNNIDRSIERYVVIAENKARIPEGTHVGATQDVAVYPFLREYLEEETSISFRQVKLHNKAFDYESLFAGAASPEERNRLREAFFTSAAEFTEGQPVYPSKFRANEYIEFLQRETATPNQLERVADDLSAAAGLPCNPVTLRTGIPQVYAGSRDPCPITLLGPNGPAAKASKAVKKFFGGEELPVKPGREGVGGGDGGIIPAEGAGQGGLGGIGGKVSNVVRESGERIGQAVSATREKILPSKITISEPEWNEKTIGIDGLQTEVDNLVSQAKGQGVPPGTKITISYFDDNLKLKTIHTKLETLATAIRNVSENNQFGTLFGELSIKFGNSGVELGSVSNLSDPQNIVWDVRNIPTKAELNYLITHSADFREKVALARDIGILGFIPIIGAAIGVTGAEAGYYYYYKPTTDKVLLKDPEAASRDPRNLPPDDFRCVGNQIVEVSAATGEVLKTLETCQSGCSSGMCQAKENTACQPGERLKVSDSSESCSLSCVDGAYARDFAQCDAIDLSGISTNRYREVVMRTLSILPDDFFPVEKFDKLSIFEVPLAHFSQGDIGDFSPEVNWRDQETELYGMASISGEHLLIGREVLSEGLVSGVSGMLIHELLHLWASQSIKPLPEGVPYSYVAAIVTETLGGSEGTPLDYPSVTGCLVGGAGSAFHDRPVDGRAINCGEDFAYAGTQYVLEACYLKNYSPERYEYFKSEVFRGKEYIPESGCPSQGG